MQNEIDRREMERLEEVCRDRGVEMLKEKYILFGEGIIFDVENKKVIVSENASDEDIESAIEYISKNVDKI